MRVDIGYDVGLAPEFLHGFDFCSHTGQSVLIRYSNSLEHSTIVAIDRLGKPDKINMCKSAFGQVSYNDDSMPTDLYFCSWSEGSGGNGRSNGYARGIERRLSWWDGEGRIERRGHDRGSFRALRAALESKGYREVIASTRWNANMHTKMRGRCESCLIHESFVEH